MDLKNVPVTPQEQRFVNLLALHPQCWFQAIERGEIRNGEGHARPFLATHPKECLGKSKIISRCRFCEIVDLSMNSFQDNVENLNVATSTRLVIWSQRITSQTALWARLGCLWGSQFRIEVTQGRLVEGCPVA